MNNAHHIPLENLSFPAYILDVKGKSRSPTGFLSLAHFFEAEKFRGYDADLYEAAVNAPTLRELRKLTKRHQANWRDDWLGVRGRVLVCGMQYAAWAAPDHERWTVNAQQLTDELIALGFPSKFSQAAVLEFTRLQGNPTWVFFGTEQTPPDVIGKRVNAIHRKCLREWTLCHWLGRHTNARIHDWALNQFIPIRYFGSRGDSLTHKAINGLTSASTKACVFEQRGGKAQDHTIQQLRGLKFPLEIEFYNVSTGM